MTRKKEEFKLEFGREFDVLNHPLSTHMRYGVKRYQTMTPSMHATITIENEN